MRVSGVPSIFLNLKVDNPRQRPVDLERVERERPEAEAQRRAWQAERDDNDLPYVLIAIITFVVLVGSQTFAFALEN